MIGSKFPLANRQCARKKRLRFCVAPEFHVQYGQVVQRPRSDGMIRSERILRNGERARTEPLRSAIFTAGKKIGSAPQGKGGRGWRFGIARQSIQRRPRMGKHSFALWPICKLRAGEDGLGSFYAKVSPRGSVIHEIAPCELYQTVHAVGACTLRKREQREPIERA
jgi:hypothetical protein